MNDLFVLIGKTEDKENTIWELIEKLPVPQPYIEKVDNFELETIVSKENLYFTLYFLDLIEYFL
jgi:hypothetical protein